MWVLENSVIFNSFKVLKCKPMQGSYCASSRLLERLEQAKLVTKLILSQVLNATQKYTVDMSYISESNQN